VDFFSFPLSCWLLFLSLDVKRENLLSHDGGGVRRWRPRIILQYMSVQLCASACKTLVLPRPLNSAFWRLNPLIFNVTLFLLFYVAGLEGISKRYNSVTGALVYLFSAQLVCMCSKAQANLCPRYISCFPFVSGCSVVVALKDRKRKDWLVMFFSNHVCLTHQISSLFIMF
jgi:hypothetical protein